MPQDLEWLPQPTVALPEPEPAPFVPPIARVGADVGAASLGCGIISPFRRDENADFANGCGLDLIRSHIENILNVRNLTDVTRGEYPWKSSFGSQVQQIRHRNEGVGVEELARFYVIDAIRIWEPRVNIRNALVSFEENKTQGNPRGPGVIMRIFLLYDVLGLARTTTLFTDVRQTVTRQFTEAA